MAFKTGTPYWNGDPQIGMGRDLSIFQIGKSPKWFGVHSNLGTNIYTYRPKLHTWNVLDALTPSYIAMFGSVQYTTAVAHRLLLEFELMALTPPHVGLSLPLTDLLDRRRAGQGAHGGTPSHHLGRRIDRQKIYNIKYTAALNGCLSMILNATTDQKLAAATSPSSS